MSINGLSFTSARPTQQPCVSSSVWGIRECLNSKSRSLSNCGTNKNAVGNYVVVGAVKCTEGQEVQGAGNPWVQ